MPSNKAELAARLAATQPGDAVRGLFFKAVFSLVQQKAGLATLEKLRVGDLAKDYSDLRTYPVQEFINLLYVAADALEQEMGTENAVYHACGESNVTRYSTGPGMLIFGIISRGDPQKLFSGAQMGYSAAVTYGTREYVTTGPKSGTLRVRRDMLPPAYHEGILTGALKVLGLKGTAKAHPQGIDRVDYDITWE
ncbi:TIGR02265 family protein [Myxococcus sp. CA051A]|uniref:TIGR02265 family protein n=1 Tax=Myxococcus llanfairpwllgwyngyllgogerychwyrndrobwllllantysiliogogogochensis TaxID=2590453 RepID=A0A540WZ70_9BACT|nr:MULTISPECIES: TIGR02265 family protein [Myxococcus]NTX05509.1 TIGR02265 family protein [Myxococcus sp. CA040A]NTX41548.1 TIGR02265 family protein [Myxococcus sp. CA033]NTX55937.1 TIGR02265 family protein [Myxococcus sp. CA039A]NTX64594.1 TIGR02265 family protein [Myxococcus sp. CA051A]TQF14270.1 TIGR02265 family protein [Myxococcus llanfairpwllgwyngyllgogerychwyrndrobwllllantysiliogogogochensis]